MRLTTERLVLRELVEADAEAANAYESDPETVRYSTYAPRSLAESLEYIRDNRRASGLVPRRLYDLAIAPLETERLIGRCGLGVSAQEPREAALWYVIHPAYRGRGLVVEAARALVDFGFRELGLHRVYCDVDSRNAASLRVAEKLGLRKEAHFRANYWCKGEWTDSIIYAVLDEEWAAR